MKKRLSLFMILVLLCVAPAASAQVFSPDALPLYSGIDVSAWQRAIDYQKVADSGVSMVYIRSSLGADSVDEYFERNARGFSEAGVLVGYYHYLTARTPEAARHQARFFANLIQDKPMDLRPVMDFERVSGLSRSEIQAISRAFLEEVESRLNIRPALYASASMTPPLPSIPFGWPTMGCNIPNPTAIGRPGQAFNTRISAGWTASRAMWIWTTLPPP